jgi:hypothetical protein
MLIFICCAAVAGKAQDAHAIAFLPDKNDYDFVNVHNFVVNYSSTSPATTAASATGAGDHETREMFSYSEGKYFPDVRGDLWTAGAQAEQWAGWDNKRCRLQMQEHMYPRLTPKTARLPERERKKRGLDDEHADTTLVIHIRSGDLFDFDYFNGNEVKEWMPAAKEGKTHEDGFYWQPPLCFYKRVIQQGNGHGQEFTKVLVVTERDKKNPTIKGLLEWRPSLVTVQSSELWIDVSTILQARHLVISHGTFSWGLALLSKELRTLYTMHSREWPVAFDAPDLNILEYKLPRYLAYWSGTEDRQRKMLDPRACEGIQEERFGLAKSTGGA